ncbi:UDP-N-acetylmuramoyl-L-alanine--D-glutamate ligase [Lacisediminihabitans profunda]|uniref:UDP-N-acetylmuramoylalanine--D-glutamate ligase n=1 Tax=Lacisediminihabitans profunda TaxID=2594790 RepID=A0A5C8UQF7_9MICO|nr:UDP-N-acetylmuramoyl-L-alanine--D-glutamate ligase [Lacisediminihabitans profunda]TXN30726.1 UDP-N-acetylmuramoyl-L-alanine--D-glutamate ligase [Lacisediminihabitans profunda]
MRTAEEIAGLSSWHADWSGLRVAVLGLGVTGFAVADTLAELGAELLVLANRADEETADLLGVIGVPLALDGLDEAFDAFAPELVVVSPGFAPHHPLVERATSRGIAVWGDVELAWRLRDKTVRVAEWIAVTGTNGKTTTVQLATAMIAASGKRVVACGNVGVPVLDAVRDPIGFDVLVVELSSFQLHYLDSMSAWASVCLNVAEDHLDWHGSAEAYREAKAKVYERTITACVYNIEDEATRTMVEQAEVVDGCRAIGFGLGLPGPSDLGVVDRIVVDRAFLDDRHRSAIELTSVDELEVVGLGSPHMVANVLAASALARSLGVAPGVIRLALRAFRLDHHRTETVAEADGIRWVDDSKATNPHAAAASLEAFDSVVWVVGGLLKGVDVNALVAANAPRLRAAVVIGSDRSAVVDAFARHAPETPLFEVDTTDTKEVMPTVVRLSAAVARSGDTVLLAPAAASMDQFTDYADRGNRFATAVHEMLGGRADDDEPPATPRNEL